MKKRIDKNGNIYVQETIRNGTKTSTRNVCKLGKLSDLMAENNWTEQQVRDWVDQTVKEMTEEKKNDPQTRYIQVFADKDLPIGIQNDSQLSLDAGYLVLQSLISSFGLPKILEEVADQTKIQYSLTDIVSCLLFNRILDPSSKLQAWKQKDSYVEDFDFSLKNVYRALDLLGQNMDEIQQKLFQNSTRVLENRNTEVLYYDCTNFFFEVEEPDEDKEKENSQTELGLRKYGVSKEHRPNPIVQMGLFVDTNGIPIRFSLFPGNQSEQISINKNVVNELHRKYKIGSFVYCADAGLASSSIKRALNSYSFPSSYIVTQSLKKMDANLQKKCLDEEEEKVWWKYRIYDPARGAMFEKKILFKDIDQSPKNKQIYYHEVWHLDKNNGNKEERLIVTYSPVYAHYLATLRSRHVERAAKKIIREGDRKRPNDPARLIKKTYIVTYSPVYAHYLATLRSRHVERAAKKIIREGDRKRPNDPARLIKKTYITAEGEVAKKAEITIDEEKIAKEARFDGFYCTSTDLDVDIDKILTAARMRWQIEDAFRVSKTCLESRPVYVWTPDHIKAHFLVCFIALLLIKTLEKIMGDQFTIEELIEALKNLRVTKTVRSQGYLPTFVRTDLTDKLMEKFDLPMQKEYISNAKMKQLIKKTKKKRKIATF